MPKKIEDRIREEAAKKVKVRITGRTRSANGFSVTYSDVTDAGTRGLCVVGPTTVVVPSKREALAILLTKARCSPSLEFSIQPAKAKR